MTRKDMISFLNRNGVKASSKDSTGRLNRKMAKYQKDQDSKVLDRRVRKITKRIQRRLRKAGPDRVSNWMKAILSADDQHSAMIEMARNQG